MQKPRSGTVVLTLAVLASVGLAPLVLRGDRAEQARLRRNYERIVGMTQAERDRLERNYARFLKMTPAEQAKWREFHNRIELDKQQNSARLANTMNDYYDWLQGISGYRREQLRNEHDDKKRMELLSKVVQEELTDELASAQEFRSLPRFGRVPILSEEELEMVFGILEEFLSRSLGSSLQEVLIAPDGSELVGPIRYLRILQKAREKYGQEFFRFLRQPELNRRILSILESRTRELLEDVPEQFGVNGIRMKTIYAIRFSLEAAIRAEERRRAPTEANLRSFFESLPEEQQHEMLFLTAEEFSERLRRMYLEHQFSKLPGGLNIREALRGIAPSEEELRSMRGPGGFRGGRRPLFERSGSPRFRPLDRDREETDRFPPRDRPGPRNKERFRDPGSPPSRPQSDRPSEKNQQD